MIHYITLHNTIASNIGYNSQQMRQLKTRNFWSAVAVKMKSFQNPGEDYLDVYKHTTFWIDK